MIADGCRVDGDLIAADGTDDLPAIGDGTKERIADCGNECRWKTPAGTVGELHHDVQRCYRHIGKVGTECLHEKRGEAFGDGILVEILPVRLNCGEAEEIVKRTDQVLFFRLRHSRLRRSGYIRQILRIGSCLLHPGSDFGYNSICVHRVTVSLISRRGQLPGSMDDLNFAAVAMFCPDGAAKVRTGK